MKPKYPQLHNIEWLKEEIQKKSLHQIAEEQKCSYSALIYVSRLYKLVIPMRRTHRKSNKPVWNKGLHPKYMQRENHYNWKGGRSHSGGGYIYIRSKNHPYADNRGYVFEHRLVMEKHLGRYLDQKEAIHHKNGIRTDNRIENLQLMKNAGENIREHFRLSHETVELREEVARLKKILDDNNISY